MHPRARATACAGGGGKARARRRGAAAPDLPATHQESKRESVCPLGGANSARNTNATRARTTENALVSRSAQPPADLIGADTQCTSIRFPTSSPGELRISPRSRPHPHPRLPRPPSRSRRRVVAFCSGTYTQCLPLFPPFCTRDLSRPSLSLSFSFSLSLFLSLALARVLSPLSLLQMRSAARYSPVRVREQSGRAVVGDEYKVLRAI